MTSKEMKRGYDFVFFLSVDLLYINHPHFSDESGELLFKDPYYLSLISPLINYTPSQFNLLISECRKISELIQNI